MKKISLSDFDFYYLSAGHYYVTYTSPVTGHMWRALVTYMPMIDATKDAEEPRRKDLETLKRYCKNHGGKIR